MTATRGCSNQNERGSAERRRKRKALLLEDYSADIPLIRVSWADGDVHIDQVRTPEYWAREAADPESPVTHSEVLPTARCYRCGARLTAETLTIDRIVPGCLGGTYARNNIRPACSGCNTETGAAMANSGGLRVAKMKARILKKNCTHCGASKGHRCTRDGKPISTFHAPRRAAA